MSSPSDPQPTPAEAALRQLFVRNDAHANYVRALQAVEELLTALLDSGKPTANQSSSWKEYRKAIRDDLHRARKRYLEVALAVTDTLGEAVAQLDPPPIVTPQ
jgi:hypothetical protein